MLDVPQRECQSQRWGANAIWPVFPENCMKMRNFLGGWGEIRHFVDRPVIIIQIRSDAYSEVDRHLFCAQGTSMETFFGETKWTNHRLVLLLPYLRNPGSVTGAFALIFFLF